MYPVSEYLSFVFLCKISNTFLCFFEEHILGIHNNMILFFDKFAIFLCLLSRTQTMITLYEIYFQTYFFAHETIRIFLN